MQETDTGDALQFHQESTTFNLNVTLIGNKLQITLQDFTEWVLYSKEYTEEDIGGEIHKKVFLTDLFYSLAFSQNRKVKNCDEKDEEEKRCIIEYNFGEIIKEDDIKCYSISRGGKITIFCIGLDTKTREQIYYESKLTLTKIR